MAYRFPMRREGRTFSPHFNSQRRTNATIRVCDCVIPTHLAPPLRAHGHIILEPGESSTIFHQAHSLAIARSIVSNEPEQLEQARLTENYSQINVITAQSDAAIIELETAENEWNQIVDNIWGKWPLDIPLAQQPPLPVHPYPLSFEIQSQSIEIYRSLHHYTARQEARFTAGWSGEMQMIHRSTARRYRRVLREGAKRMSKFCRNGGNVEEVADGLDDVIFDSKSW